MKPDGGDMKPQDEAIEDKTERRYKLAPGSYRSSPRPTNATVTPFWGHISSKWTRKWQYIGKIGSRAGFIDHMNRTSTPVPYLAALWLVNLAAAVP